ncbi:MAG TPA: SHOCT domain-containing protein [Acidimicrobiales bacterium]|nr:SHOCT domain-containing protein [Acidimicrobiales bacterium]
MHYGWNDGWSGWTWATMTIGMIVFWALVIWAVIAVARSSNAADGDTRRSPEQILAARFAAGEIDSDEYHRRLEDLRSTAASGR